MHTATLHTPVCPKWHYGGNEMDDLYRELKPDVEAVAGPLLDMSEQLVCKHGHFLPHGAVLTESGETQLIMAAVEGLGERDVAPAEVLPLLHDALRATAAEKDHRATAVCEEVTITLEGQKPTAAIKVLVEHRRGLCVALYLPYRRKLLRGYDFGSVFVKPADPEVRAWGDV